MARKSICQSDRVVGREMSAEEIALVSGGALPVIIYTGAKWIGGAFAAGFIGKAGADLYDYLLGEDGC
jgi:hypothetical protein